VNWTIFAIFTYVTLVLQLGLAPTLQLTPDIGEVQPSFVIVFAVFVAMHAPTKAVVISWAVLGLLLDLLTEDYAAAGAVLVGPYTFAFLAGSFVALQLRQVVLKQHLFSLAFCTVICGAAVALVYVGIFGVRNLYDPPHPNYSAVRDLAVHTLEMLYSGFLALALGLPLLKATSLFSFQATKAGMRR
jgi:cell shape-determining protein MreD